MADLPETDEFPEGVYQIETTDPVVGGLEGIANAAARALASRTRWLKNQLAALQALTADFALKTGDYSGLRARATTKDDVGLGNVPNFAATNDASGGSSSLLATAKAVKDYVAAQLGSLSLTAGLGLSGGAGAIELGAPSTVSGLTGNTRTDTSHTHAILSTASRSSSSTEYLLEAKAMADHVAAGDHADATISVAGFMSPGDKAKLNGIAAGAQVNPPTTAARNSAATGTVLQAKAMADHVASGDHDGRYALLGRTVSAGGGLTGGGDLTANRTISHADTSSQSSVNGSGGVVVQDVTLDGYGHVTGLGTVNLDGRYLQPGALVISTGVGGYWWGVTTTSAGDPGLPGTWAKRGETFMANAGQYLSLFQRVA